MNTVTRLLAGTAGAGVLALAAATTASAAPSDGPTGQATETGHTTQTGQATGEQQAGQQPTQVQALQGVPAVPVPGTVLEQVPTSALGAGVLPLALVSDALGEGGSTATSNGAQAGPGSAEA